MRDTAFSVPEEHIDRLATSYSTDDKTGKVEVYDEGLGGQWSRPPAFPSGGGGLVSTADDYLAFAQMMLRGGKPILSRPTVELMTTDHLTPEQCSGGEMILGADRGWGFGMAIVNRRQGLPSIGTFGWDGGLGTSWASDPKEQLTGILLTQQAWTSPTTPAILNDFWTLAYGAIDD
jgi:CubicO group peptidase (beta-lactamase class C family)